jgi:hypothetical protein
MRVRFFGTKESVTSWRKVVRTSSKKFCAPVNQLSDGLKKSDRYYFTAYIDEGDSEQLLEHWYLIEEGHDMAWNLRISFHKFDEILKRYIKNNGR